MRDGRPSASAFKDLFVFLQREKMVPVSIFYDSSCFPTIREEELKVLLKGNNNFFISPVLEEIRQGYQLRSAAREFSHVLDNKGHLRKSMYEISLDNCFKLAGDAFRKAPLMHLKRNPVLCSAYYTWIISAKKSSGRSRRLPSPV